MIFVPPANPANPAALSTPPGLFGSNFAATLRLVAPAAEVLSTIAPNNAWLVFSQASGRSSWSALDEPFTYTAQGQQPVTISTGPANSVGWGTMTGTSMAAPHISAIAGLVRSVNPLKPATAIEELIASSTNRFVQHQGFTFRIPDAGGAVNAALGSVDAINRRTPMLAMWSGSRRGHFYTTSPQEANAALRGTLLPRDPNDTVSNGAWTDFAPTGNDLYFFDRFPQVMCIGTTPCNFAANMTIPRALFEVWTGYRNPYDPGQGPLRALYRMSRTVTVGNEIFSKHAYAVCVPGAPSCTDRSALEQQGYTLDALDGFIVGADQSRPPGTFRLCRKQYAGTDARQQGDFLFYIEPDSGPVCAQADDCGAPNGNCGFAGGYTGTGGLNAHVGYVFASENANDGDNDSMLESVEIAEGRNPAVKDNDIFAVSRLFVYQQAKDTVRRQAQDHELQTLASQIDGGQKTRAAVVEEFINHPEHFPVFAPVIRLYRAFLSRFPDYEGLEYWTRTIRGGTPLETISQAFATSQEFINATGALDNGQFITYCYQNVLGQAPDPGGFAFWTGQLDSGAMTRGRVMLAFSESLEFTGIFQNNVRVIMLFHSLLRRAPLQVGYDYWVNQLGSGTSLQSAIGSFIGTTEYRLRFLPS